MGSMKSRPPSEGGGAAGSAAGGGGRGIGASVRTGALGRPRSSSQNFPWGRET